MAKKGMARPDWTHTHPRNDVPPVPELQGKAKRTKAKANPIIRHHPGAGAGAAAGGPLPSHLRRPAVLQQQMLLAGAGAEAGGQFRRAGLGAHPHL